jgi:hypothetical protein
MLDHVNPEHHLRSMIGYHLAWENSLVGMVMVQGKQREVVNIGLGIKQVAVEPRDVTVSAYVESLSHKVCSTRFPLSWHGTPTRPCRATPTNQILTPSSRPARYIAHGARDVLPGTEPWRRGRTAPAVHPARAQGRVHQGDRATNRIRLVPTRVQHIRGDVQRGRPAADRLGVPLVQGTSGRAATQHRRRGELPVRHGPLPRHPRLQVRMARQQ